MPDSVSTEPSLLVVVQVVVNLVWTSYSGGKVVKVATDDPDWLTMPDSVSTEPSLLVVVQVVVNSAWTSDSVDSI